MTAGTALGTLALAFYTFRLAQSTKNSVEGSQDELTEVRAQRALLVEQAEASRQQAQATADLVAASKANTDQAYRARIDAYAPLVNMTVSAMSVQYMQGQSGSELVRGIELNSVAGDSRPISVTLRFDFTNHGHSPALLFFGGEAALLDRIVQNGSNRVVLAPGGSYADTLAITGSIADFTRPKLQRIKVTYNGLLHGEVFDTITWYGEIRPFRVSGETAVVSSLPNTLNGSEAQVVRTYPNLERPDEMAQVRARLLGYEHTPTGDTQR